MFEKIHIIHGISIIFPLCCLIFRFFILDNMLESTNKKINNYRCLRSDNRFNVSFVKETNKIIISDKKDKKKTLDFSILEKSSKGSVGWILFKSFYTKNSFNVRVSNNLLSIYSLHPFPQEVYTLDQKVETLDELLNSKVIYNPVSKEMLNTFVYLVVKGYLNYHLCLLYRRTLLIYYENGRSCSFDIDLSPLIGKDLTEGTNNLLALFTISDTLLLYYSSVNIENRQIVDLRKFRDLFKSFLWCDKDRKIKDLIFYEKFLETKDHIQKQEIDDLIKEITKKEIKDKIMKKICFDGISQD